MSESIKQQPPQTPESYSPKTRPIILTLAEAANQQSLTANAFAIKNENGNVFIDSVPVLRWGEWKDCSYVGTLTLASMMLGNPVSYETLMGVSGLCYRTGLKQDWCPSSQLPQNGPVHDNNINAALGFTPYAVADEIERNQKIKDSIRMGLPVAGMFTEWGIITGFSEKENKFFGRSYFDSQHLTSESHYYNPENTYTENCYTATDFPGFYPNLFLRFFDKPCEKTAPADLLKKSLAICVDEVSFDNMNDHYRLGKAALRTLIEGFSKSDEEWRQSRRNENYHIGCLVDARRCAAVYLKESASLLSGRPQKKLLAVSAQYQFILDGILEAIPYAVLNEEFAFNGNTKEPWSGEVRRKLVTALQQTLIAESKIKETVQDILSNWEEVK